MSGHGFELSVKFYTFFHLMNHGHLSQRVSTGTLKNGCIECQGTNTSSLDSASSLGRHFGHNSLLL